MAKKNVVIFDGEDKFINPKKAVYSKSKGLAKKVESFKSAISDDERKGRFTQNYGEQVQDGNENANQSYSQQVQDGNAIPGGLGGPGGGPSEGPLVSPIEYTIPGGLGGPGGGPSEGPLVSPIEIPAPPVFNIPNPFISQPSYEETRNAEYIERPVPIYMAPTPELPSLGLGAGGPNPDGGGPDGGFIPLQPLEPIGEPERFYPRDMIDCVKFPQLCAPTPDLPILQPIGEPERFYPRDMIDCGKFPWDPECAKYNDDRKTIMPVYDTPISVTQPRLDDVYDGRRPPRMDDLFPNLGIPDGRLPITPPNPYQPYPILTAPVPPLPPRGRITEDPMGGGGSPVMAGPEIPRPNCPTGFVFNSITGICTPILDRDPILVPRDTTSSTTSTTTKAAAVPTTVDKTCNPPSYAAPTYYKWVSKGNCAYELVVDDTQLKDAAPAPVLPATGQPIININIPTGTTGGGLGTIPTTSTTVQTTTKSLLPKGEDSGGSGGGGGGGSPFPEEPAPIGPAPKKNYFWWYVGGAMAIYLLMKRKNKE